MRTGRGRLLQVFVWWPWLAFVIMLIAVGLFLSGFTGRADAPGKPLPTTTTLTPYIAAPYGHEHRQRPPAPAVAAPDAPITLTITEDGEVTGEIASTTTTAAPTTTTTTTTQPAPISVCITPDCLRIGLTP